MIQLQCIIWTNYGNRLFNICDMHYCSISPGHQCILISRFQFSMSALLSGLWLDSLTWMASHVSWTSWRAWTMKPLSHRSTRLWSAASKLWWTTRRAAPTSFLTPRASTSLLRAWPRRTWRPRWQCWRSWALCVWCLAGTKKSCKLCCTTSALPVRGHGFRWVGTSQVHSCSFKSFANR